MTEGIFILTGEVDSGKTSRVAAWVEYYRGHGKRTGGVLAPANWKGGNKVSYDILDLSTGERRLMASVEPIRDGERFGGFWFSKKGMRLGNQALVSLNPGWDVGVVDEIGPLELKGKGLATGFREVLQHPPGKLIVVVRKGLVEEVAGFFNIKDFRCLGLTSPTP